MSSSSSPNGFDWFGATDVDRLITQALIIGDFEAAVSLCLHDDRMADAIILAIAGGPELLEKTQKKYLTKTQSKIGKVRQDIGVHIFVLRLPYCCFNIFI